MYISISGRHVYAFDYEVLRVSGIWKMFRKLNTAEVDGPSKDMLICFIVATGDESRECFLFRGIAAAESELRGDITGKRRNSVDLVPGIRKY